MSLPFVFPSSAAEGPGRLTEVASFKKSDIDSSRFQAGVSTALKTTSTFSPFRQCRVGDGDETHTLLIFDWTSSAEKTLFEKEQNNTKLKSAMTSWAEVIDKKNPSMIRHHITLPGSLTTPKCAYYEAATLTIDPSQHSVFAASMEKYANAIGEKVFNYLAVAVSEDSPEDMVLIFGYPSKGMAEFADKSEQHMEAKKINDPLVKGWWKMGSSLEMVIEVLKPVEWI